MTYRILITGSRDWDDYDLIFGILRDNFDRARDYLVVHGGAPGADSMAGRAARSTGKRVEVHPADWDAPCDDQCPAGHRRTRNGKDYCPRQGFIRNKKMVDLGADICLAFIKNNSKGASMTAALAEKAGIPVRRYEQ